MKIATSLWYTEFVVRLAFDQGAALGVVEYSGGTERTDRREIHPTMKLGM